MINVPSGQLSRESALSSLSAVVSRAAGSSGADAEAELALPLRHRYLGDSEVASAVLAEHKPATVGPFLERMLWRTYCRGWMEGRSGAYLTYRRQVADDFRRFGVTEAYQKALSGTTGLDAFDAWNEELTSHGRLSFPARQWYASIWIFSLRLPWSLGAAHFQEHLLDVDAAEVVLGWRSVAGLQPPGKHLLAKADEIARFSEGRFDLKGRLNESAVAQKGPALPPAALMPLPPAASDLLGENYALLVTPEDLTPETTSIGSLRPKLVLIPSLESLAPFSYRFSAQVSQATTAALTETRLRLAEVYGCPVIDLPQGGDLAGALGQRLGEDEIPHLVYQHPTVGPWQDLVVALTGRDVGLRFFPLRRSWDAALFPHASQGFAHFQSAAMPLLTRARGQL